MRTATVADLRNNFRRVSAWIENGEPVEIIRRGHVFARLVPNQPEAPVEWPDFLARAKAHSSRPMTPEDDARVREYDQEE